MDTKTIFIGGIFPQGHTEQLKDDGKIPVQIAFDTLQKNIIKGLEEGLGEHVTVFNMYFLLSEFFKPYKIDAYTWNDGNGENYNLPFNDLKGYVHFSKYKSLKKALRTWLCENNPKGKTRVIVYPAYFPFLTALKKLKKQFDLDVCLVVADLPEYMGLGSKKSLYNKISSLITGSLYKNAISSVDSFVLLTEQMNEKTNFYGKPYTVMEGIASGDYKFLNAEKYNSPKVVIYSGGLQLKYGIDTLLEASGLVDKTDVEFRFYGTGEAESLIKQYSEKDGRIKYCGTLSLENLNSEQQKSTVLVNPRQNTDEYTKYSFPSKTLEYMLSGRPLVAYMLDGMPNEYGDYILSPSDNSPKALADKITEILDMTDEEQDRLGNKAREFVLKNKNYISQTEKIIQLINK